MSAPGRYCCKSTFALLIKNSPGRRRDFRVTMWGTSSPDGKSTGDLANAIENTNIDRRRSDGLLAGNLSPGNFRLLQQYRPGADVAWRASKADVDRPCDYGLSPAAGSTPNNFGCCCLLAQRAIAAEEPGCFASTRPRETRPNSWSIDAQASACIVQAAPTP
jgi:hypothetical protein